MSDGFMTSVDDPNYETSSGNELRGGRNGLRDLIRNLIREVDKQALLIKEVDKTLTEVRVEIATLKTKAQIGGFLAGLIPTIALFAIKYLIDKK